MPGYTLSVSWAVCVIATGVLAHVVLADAVTPTGIVIAGAVLGLFTQPRLDVTDQSTCTVIITCTRINTLLRRLIADPRIVAIGVFDTGITLYTAAIVATDARSYALIVVLAWCAAHAT